MIKRQISAKAGNDVSIYFPSEKQLLHYQAPVGYIFRNHISTSKKDSHFKGNRSEVKICLEARRGSVLRDTGSCRSIADTQADTHTHTHTLALK